MSGIMFYGIGCLIVWCMWAIAIYCVWKFGNQSEDEITVLDLLFVIFTGLSSWVGVVLGLFAGISSGITWLTESKEVENFLSKPILRKKNVRNDD